MSKEKKEENRIYEAILQVSGHCHILIEDPRGSNA
jgi:hypothetical protein